MTHRITTRRFPVALVARVGDLIPNWCRSAAISHAEDDGPVTASAHPSEIKYVRRAIASARLEASVSHIR